MSPGTDFVDFVLAYAVGGKSLHEGVLDRQDFLMGYLRLVGA